MQRAAAWAGKVLGRFPLTSLARDSSRVYLPGSWELGYSCLTSLSTRGPQAWLSLLQSCCREMLSG